MRSRAFLAVPCLSAALWACSADTFTASPDASAPDASADALSDAPAGDHDGVPCGHTLCDDFERVLVLPPGTPWSGVDKSDGGQVDIVLTQKFAGLKSGRFTLALPSDRASLYRNFLTTQTSLHLDMQLRIGSFGGATNEVSMVRILCDGGSSVVLRGRSEEMSLALEGSGTASTQVMSLPAVDTWIHVILDVNATTHVATYTLGVNTGQLTLPGAITKVQGISVGAQGNTGTLANFTSFVDEVYVDAK